MSTQINNTLVLDNGRDKKVNLEWQAFRKSAEHMSQQSRKAYTFVSTDPGDGEREDVFDLASSSACCRSNLAAFRICVDLALTFRKPCTWSGFQPSGRRSSDIHLRKWSTGIPVLVLDFVSQTPRMIAISPRAISAWTASMGRHSASLRTLARGDVFVIEQELLFWV